VAARNEASPAWFALIVQVPVVKTVIVVPVIVQIEAVALVYATVKLDDAVAAGIGAAPPSVIGDKSGNVMVCAVRAVLTVIA
jgi:hypothetical protein